MAIQMGSVFRNDRMVGTTVTVNMSGAPLPCTITLHSAAAGRKIELNPDGGSEVFAPALDTTTATMLVLAVKAPVSFVVFTGAAGDTWSIR
jgi:hypothetical protein